MRDKAPDEPPPGIPFWFVTYSDVITLLMTFFILLLTFATSEPEKFERMQVAVFGGRGANGVEEEAASLNDSIVRRERPRQSRFTKRGSETAPLDSDPPKGSLAEGLAGLDEPIKKSPTVAHSMTLPIGLVVDGDDAPTAVGIQVMRMLARQLKKDPFNLQVQVSSRDDLPKAVVLARYMFEKLSIVPGKISVGVAHDASSTKGSMLHFTLKRRTER